MTSPPLIGKLALIGAGLIGGSIARAARAAGAAKTIVATARSPETRRRIMELGFGDQVTETNAEAVKDADLVIVSIPVGASGAVAQEIGLMLDDQAQPKIPMDKVIAHELQILGSHGMQAFRYDAMLAMILSGKLAPQKLVGKTIGLDEAPAALMAMDRFEGTGIGVITKF